MARDGVEETADGRFLVVRGRRWRRQDPALPEDVAATLRSHLGRARSAVGRFAGDDAAVAAARARVDAAKRGLGERGEPWWEQDDAARRARWEHALALLDTLPPPPSPVIMHVGYGGVPDVHDHREGWGGSGGGDRGLGGGVGEGAAQRRLPGGAQLGERHVELPLHLQPGAGVVGHPDPHVRQPPRGGTCR